MPWQILLLGCEVRAFTRRPEHNEVGWPVPLPCRHTFPANCMVDIFMRLDRPQSYIYQKKKKSCLCSGLNLDNCHGRQLLTYFMGTFLLHGSFLTSWVLSYVMDPFLRHGSFLTVSVLTYFTGPFLLHRSLLQGSFLTSWVLSNCIGPYLFHVSLLISWVLTCFMGLYLLHGFYLLHGWLRFSWVLIYCMGSFFLHGYFLTLWVL